MVSHGLALSFPLMNRPQITYNFHHYLAVNFVVAGNLFHHWPDGSLARPAPWLARHSATRRPSPPNPSMGLSAQSVSMRPCECKALATAFKPKPSAPRTTTGSPRITFVKKSYQPSSGNWYALGALP